jgi:hypothetical protein
MRNYSRSTRILVSFRSYYVYKFHRYDIYWNIKEYRILEEEEETKVDIRIENVPKHATMNDETTLQPSLSSSTQPGATVSSHAI